jgi:hypothetical protein
MTTQYDIFYNKPLPILYASARAPRGPGQPAYLVT